MTALNNSEVAVVFESYPPAHRAQMMALRRLILDTADQSEDIGAIEETLKWGEPSYVTKKGSAVRLAWKEKSPDQYRLCFYCQTNLIETFRELYAEELEFDGNRAIVIHRQAGLPGAGLPTEILMHCIELSLNYHRIKHLPLLGA